MVVYKNVPILIFTSVIFLAKVRVDGFVKSCPTNVIFNRTEGTPCIPGFVGNTGNISSTKKCIFLCCSLEKVWKEGICIKDNETSDNSSRFISLIDDDRCEEKIPENDNRFFFFYDPCDIGWMASSILKDFIIFKNGSFQKTDSKGDSLSDFEEYCLMWEPRSTGYLARVCQPWVMKGYYEVSCLIIAIFILLAIFIVYTIVPVLKNFHGLIFRSYIATYIGVYMFSLGVMYTTQIRIDSLWFNYAEISTRYCAGSCALWLNVMCFNIWRSFRGLHSNCCNSREEKYKRFMYYAIYAWFSPIILIGITLAIIINVPYFHRNKFGNSLKQWTSVGIVVIAVLINIILHIWTAFNIRLKKRDTAYIANGVNKHYKVDEQWFYLYLRLFVIMGAHIVTWPIWLVWPIPEVTHVLTTMELGQTILLFVIFIWKDNVKRALRERFFSNGISIIDRR